MMVFPMGQYQTLAQEPELPVDHLISGGTFSLSNVKDGDRVLASGDVTLNGNRAYQAITVICAPNTNLIINDVYIDNSETSYLDDRGYAYYVSGIVFEGGVNTLTLIGYNSVKSGRNKAAINVPLGSELTIKGFDYLEAIGNLAGAGIGGNISESSGLINIEDGQVVAKVYYYMNSYTHAAGIGSGGTYSTVTGTYADAITISGGNVTAIGGQGAAGIGGGLNANSSDITISNDAVVFSSGNQYIYLTYYDIGGGDNSTYTGPVRVEDDASLFLRNNRWPSTLVSSMNHTSSAFYGIEVTNNEAFGVTFPSEWNGLVPYGYTTLRCARFYDSAEYRIFYQFERVGEKITQPSDPIPDPGKEFVGWYTNSDVRWDFSTDTLIDQIVFLSSRFKDIPSLTGTITFDNISPRPLDLVSASFIPDMSISGTLSYKWLREGVAIPGETLPFYRVSEEDVGKTLSFEVGSDYEINSVKEDLYIEKYEAIQEISTPSALIITHNSVVIEEQIDCEYAIVTSGAALDIGIDWQSGNTFTELESSTKYDIYARSVETDKYKAGTAVGPQTVTTMSSQLQGELLITGAFAFGETLTAVPDVNAINDVWYAWFTDGEEVQDGFSNTYVIGQEDIGKNLSCSVYDQDAGRTGLLGSVSSSPTMVMKASGGTPVEPELLSKTTSAITLKPISGYEYRMNGGLWQTSNVFSGLASNSSFAFTQRLIETETSYASVESSSVTFGTSAVVTSSSSGSKSTTTTIVDDPLALGTITESQKGSDTIISVESDQVRIEFNGLAFSNLINQEVETIIKEVKKEDLNLAKDLEEEIGDLPVYDISVYVDGNKTHFDSEEPIVIEIAVDSALEEHKVVAVYIDEEGNTQMMEGVLSDGVMRFVTYHLSEYALMYLDKSFLDVEDYWGQESIEALASRQIVEGVGKDLFNPEGEITRAEFTTMVVRYFGFESQTSTSIFKDVIEDAWYAGSVSAGYQAGILPELYGDMFEPNKAITREEMMSILYESLLAVNQEANLVNTGIELNDFSDGESLASYAVEAAEYLIGVKVINGYGNGMLMPKATSTRSEVAQMLWNMINLSELLN